MPTTYQVDANLLTVNLRNVPHAPYNGSGLPPDSGGQPAGHASFAHIYGTFPTSMGMEVAAALLRLRTKRPPDRALSFWDGVHAPPRNPRIACLKTGATGDWGMIVIGRDNSH